MSEPTPSSGPSTFLKAPYVPEPTTADGDVAVIGVPYDEGVTGRAGTREGPEALRAISTNWAYRQGAEAFWDGEARATLLDGVRLVDTGDVELAPTAPVEVVHLRIAERVEAVVRAGLFPLVLGGDHSITYPVLQGVGQTRADVGRQHRIAGAGLYLVHFDTHMDYWDEIGGLRYTHGSPMIRAHEAGLVDGIVQYGIRGLHTVADNIELAQERGVISHWCEETKRALQQGCVQRLVEHIPPDADVWITFDIDCLDPAIAPGTGTPEPGGFTYYETKTLLLAVARRTRVVGMDLVEVNPLCDPGELAALHGARLIIDTLGAVFRRTGEQ